MDLCTPLHHTWTYQALVHDVLVSELSNNTSSWMYRMTDGYNLTKIIIITTIIIEFTFPQNDSPMLMTTNEYVQRKGKKSIYMLWFKFILGLMFFELVSILLPLFQIMVMNT